MYLKKLHAKTLLLAAGLCVGAGTVWAEDYDMPSRPFFSTDWETPTAGETYYIYNVSSGLFLGGGREWGTRAICTLDRIHTTTDAMITCTANVDYVLPFSLEKSGDNWLIIHQNTNKATGGNKYLQYSSGDGIVWVDNNSNGDNSIWKIETGADGYYLVPLNKATHFGVHATNIVSWTLALTWNDLDSSTDKWIDWKFVSASKADLIKAYKEKYNLYNYLAAAVAFYNATKDNVGGSAKSALKDALDAAMVVYNSATATVAEVVEQETSLNDAVKAYQLYVTVTYPLNLSASIINSTIDGSANGWNAVKTISGNGPYGSNNLEYWSYTEGEGNFDYYQNLAALPVGKYTITADMFNDQVAKDGDSFVAAAGVYATNSASATVSKTVDVQGATPNTYATTEIETTDGMLRVGVKYLENTMTARWFVADNFVLTLRSPSLSYWEGLYDDAKGVAEAIDQSLLSGSVLSDLQTAINASVNKSDENALKAAIIALQDATKNAMTIEYTIAANKGDITSLINGDFQTDATGWSGGGLVSWVQKEGWRGSSYTNNYYETTTSGTMTYTLPNMPAGSYKVVAAARTYNGGKLKAQVAGGDYGTELTGVGNAAVEGRAEINTNGVEMPYSSLTGFTTVATGHNWRWITATGTLAEDGDLVINFTATGNSWMAIDDVHLYCTSLGGTSYTTTVVEGSDVSNSDGKVVTCDIILNNPNTIVTSSAAITTAAGETMNNNLVGSNIAQMILYDGANNTFSMAEGNYTINNVYGAAKYYRQLTKDQFCTVCLPFTPAIGTGTYYAPTSFVDGTLTFAAVADADLKPNTPYILKPSGSYTDLWNNNHADNSDKYNVVYSGVRPATNVSDGALYFTGTYEKIANIGAWSGTYYVLGTDNNLHKVTGAVGVNPFRAYFFVPEPAHSARSVINLNFEDEQTGLKSIREAEQANDGIVYNLSGQRVDNPAKGLYIVNGKKVVIK